MHLFLNILSNKNIVSHKKRPKRKKTSVIISFNFYVNLASGILKNRSKRQIAALYPPVFKHKRTFPLHGFMEPERFPRLSEVLYDIASFHPFADTIVVQQTGNDSHIHTKIDFHTRVQQIAFSVSANHHVYSQIAFVIPVQQQLPFHRQIHG